VKSPLPDSTPKLRAAYQQFLERRDPLAESPCPDPEELLALAEGTSAEEDRLRTMDHIAQCPGCRREFDLLRSVAGAQPTRKIRVRPWMAAAASVAILFGGGYGVWRGVGGGRDTVLRGPESSVELLSPAEGEVGPGEIEFNWQPLPDAYEYVLEILDLESESVFARTSSDTSYRLDLDEHPAIEGDLLWWVRARLGDGTERSSQTRPLAVPRR
jgi:hypothetical protein